MPTLEHIQKEVAELKQAGQDSVRKRYLKRLNKLTGRDTVIYFSAYNVLHPFPIPPAALSVSQGDVQGFMAALHGLRGEKLDLILHSPGGSLEAAEQIVQYLRSKYSEIRAIVPQNAMSAATMIAMAADEIVLGKHSAIGPIDPQLTLNGVPVPAHTILADFDQAKADISGNPMLGALWGPRFASLPPGYLNLCKQTIDLSKEKVERWLAQYMFKGKDPQKAKEIADWLGNFDHHRTHGRPIGFELASERGLKVIRLEDDQKLQEAVLSVFHKTMVTFLSTQCLKIVENHNGKGHYVVAQLMMQPGFAGPMPMPPVPPAIPLPPTAPAPPTTAPGTPSPNQAALSPVPSNAESARPSSIELALPNFSI